MALYCFIEKDGVLKNKNDLEIRDTFPRLNFIKISETKFKVQSMFRNGHPNLNYDIDITKLQKNVIHSLYGYNTQGNYIPEDRILMNIFEDMPYLEAEKGELGCLRMSHMPNGLPFYIDDDLNVFIYSRNYTYFENVNPIFVQTNNFNQILSKYCPTYKDSRKENTLKLKTLLKLDCNNSLSYIENQLDLLSIILFNIIDNNTKIKNEIIKNIPNYESFKNIIETLNINKIKSNEKCLQEIKELKSNVRNIQKNYYIEKEKLLNE